MWGKVATAALLMSAATGCNTDGLWQPRQNAKGPVTSIDHPDGVEVPDIQIADAKEVDLVEDVLLHRALYHRSIKALHEYYEQHGFDSKRAWAARELAEADRITPFRYILAAEIPSDTLSPRDSIAEADAMYEHGRTLMGEGGEGVPMFFRASKMREALAVFRKLIETYPSSDKIDDAAFYSGEIHKEYFRGEEAIAVKWYERAFTWNPQTEHPARFQAAVVYDFRLHDRSRALELYQDIITRESGDQSNMRFAVRRIGQLTSDDSPAKPAQTVGSQATSATSPDSGEKTGGGS